MKKYYFTFNIANRELMFFVLAENKIEAKKMAILIVKLHIGNYISIQDVDTIQEITEDDFYTMEKIEEEYKARNKKIILPRIKGEED